MLSIGIKNSILVLLIVLILHFLLKNLILERKPSVPQETAKRLEPYQNKDPTDTRQISKEEACRNVRLDDVQKKKLEQEEMMRYVAMGDESEDKTLDKYFRDNIVSDEVKDLEKSLQENTACKYKEDDKHLPVTTTCNAEVQSLAVANNMKVRADCNLKQDKKNIMILTEYEDEKDMNGGALFGGLSAFDGFDVNYQTYSCGLEEKN